LQLPRSLLSQRLDLNFTKNPPCVKGSYFSLTLKLCKY